MRGSHVKIGVMAPATRLTPDLAQRLQALVGTVYPGNPAEIRIHPQCFLSAGHFAGDDAAREAAFLEYANDESLDALWFARGGYGAGRIAPAVDRLSEAARQKLYLGYSDAGYLLGALYRRGFAVAHGPMPADLLREGGEAAVARALKFLVERAPDALEPTLRPGEKYAAFNMTVLSQMIGTPCQPELSGHVLMLEDVAEYMYRIDRTLFHLTSTAAVRQVTGIRLGRVSDVPQNDPDFGQNEEQVTRHWCDVSGIPYLGRADIGHDCANRIVPFGLYR
jgi:muramoyltetrapeptide carboxypeptidase